MAQVLINDSKSTGKYVAITELNHPVVISTGADPEKVYAEAVRKGYTDPTILYVPEKDLVQIYCHY